nr:MAG TPA: hypothetical protein [Caudoviricetes sp.]
MPTGQRCTVGLRLMTSKSKGLSQATPIGFRQGRRPVQEVVTNCNSGIK